MRVVDLLEVVDIEHGHAQRGVVRQGGVYGHVQALLGTGVVEQPGQAIEIHGAAQHAVALDLATHHGVQHHRVERFGQEVVSTQAQGVHLQGNAGVCREIHHRRGQKLFVLADDPRHFHTGAAGHVHVHQHQIRLELVQRQQHFLRLGNGHGLHARLLECALDQGAGGLGVFHHQHTVGRLHLATAELDDPPHDGRLGCPYGHAEVAAHTQRELHGLEVPIQAHANDGRGREAFTQGLHPHNEGGGGQAQGINQHDGRVLGGFLVVLVTADLHLNVEIARLRSHFLPGLRRRGDQPDLLGREQVDHEVAVFVQAPLGVLFTVLGQEGIDAAAELDDACVQIIERGRRGDGVAVPTVKLRQYVLLHRPGKLVQTRQTARVQELGEAGYGHGKFNKPVNTGVVLAELPFRQELIGFAREFYGRTRHGSPCGRVIPVYAEIVGGLSPANLRQITRMAGNAFFAVCQM